MIDVLIAQMQQAHRLELAWMTAKIAELRVELARMAVEQATTNQMMLDEIMALRSTVLVLEARS